MMNTKPHAHPHLQPVGHVHGPGCSHVHAGNAAAMLATAESFCLQRGLRLTPQRRAVLEALAEAGRPCGAYDLIETLRAKGGRTLAPIAIYRALDFLRENGLIHRLELLNAFVACAHHQHHGDERVIFLICESCKLVEETAATPLSSAIADITSQHGFQTRRQIIEIAGLCKDCSGSGTHP